MRRFPVKYYLFPTQMRAKPFGGVAQLGEHLPCKQGVRSSILLISTKGRRKTNSLSAVM